MIMLELDKNLIIREGIDLVLPATTTCFLLVSNRFLSHVFVITNDRLVDSTEASRSRAP